LTQQKSTVSGDIPKTTILLQDTQTYKECNFNVYYKENWEKCKPRFEAWWNRSATDRPLVQVECRRNIPLPYRPVAKPNSVEMLWTDADYRIDAFEEYASQRYYGGDSFPDFSTDIGPGSLALFLGSQPTFMPDTVWYNKCLNGLDDPLPDYNPDNKWWQANLNICKRGVERLREKAIVTIPDLIEGLDILASLRGTSELLFDIVERPDDVHRWLRRINKLYFDYYDRIYDVIKDENGGSAFVGFKVWGPGRVAKLQCDISAMISPEMFEEFVAPYLQEQCRKLDYTVYHLDGPEAIRHLDILCSIPELDAIQWTSGAGNPGMGDPVWMPIYRKIRSANKSALILFVTPKEAEAIISELGHEGLNFYIPAENEEEADEIVKQSANWRKS
jgi:5-methyltetrahydrofolate--homocysteine methyltransferase